MSRRFREAGFTLLELLTVLMIIGVVAGMALSRVDGAAPRFRLVANVNEMNLMVQKTRAAAVRTGRMHKICFFRDSDTTDKLPRGRVYEFGCNQLGMTSGTGCTAVTNVCNDAFATVGPANNGYPTDLYDSAKVTALGTACPGLTAAATWCLVDFVDLGNSFKSKEHISITKFKDSTGAVIAAQKRVEVTFLPTGALYTDQTTTGFAGGTVVLTNYDQCKSFPCSSWANEIGVKYGVGGTTRVVGQ